MTCADDMVTLAEKEDKIKSITEKLKGYLDRKS